MEILRQGVESPEGRVAFDPQPIFAGANTHSPHLLQLPDTAGKPFARLEIQQLPTLGALYFSFSSNCV